jgi:predicted NUDIX family phosphoesterase
VENGDYIQPIPVAVLTNQSQDKVLVLKKKQKTKDHPENNKYLLYAGGHIRKEDSFEEENNTFIEIARSGLIRELKEELGVNLVPDGIEPFLIYTPIMKTSKRHMALCFILKVDFSDLKFKLDEFELEQSRGKGKGGSIFSLEELNKELQKENVYFDSWSIEILSHVFGIKKETLFFDDQETTLEDIN